MDRESPEVIEAQMRETRCSLQAKLAAAEEKVASTVRQASGAVESAAATVKETVDDSLGKVRDTMASAAHEVRHFFDVREQVREHPLSAVGVAAGVGFAAALLLPRGGPSPAPAPQPLAGFVPQPAPAHHRPAAPAARDEGWFGEVMALARREAKEFTETLIRSFSGALRDKVAEASPNLVQDALAAAVPGFAPHRNGAHPEDSLPPFVRGSYAAN